jgi:hypothetical protein
MQSINDNQLCELVLSGDEQSCELVLSGDEQSCELVLSGDEQSILEYLFSHFGMPGIMPQILAPITRIPTLVQCSAKGMLVEFFRLLHYSAEQVVYLSNIATFILMTDDAINQELLEQVPALNTIQINEMTTHISSLFEYIAPNLNESQNAAINTKKNAAYFFCFYHVSFERSIEVSTLLNSLDVSICDLFHEAQKPNDTFINRYFQDNFGMTEDVSISLTQLIIESLMHKTERCHAIFLQRMALKNCTVISPMIFAINKILQIYNCFLDINDQLIAFKLKPPKRYKAAITESESRCGDGGCCGYEDVVVQKVISSAPPVLVHEVFISIAIKHIADNAGFFEGFAGGTVPFNDHTKFDVRAVHFRTGYTRYIARPENSCAPRKLRTLVIRELYGFEITDEMIHVGIAHLAKDKRAAALHDIRQQLGLHFDFSI